MTLVRWDPFRELEDMSERLNRVFSRPTLRNTGKKISQWPTGCRRLTSAKPNRST